jgi:HK97 family phage prohead protease
MPDAPRKPSRMCFRAYGFEAAASDGHTLEGYAAVFGSVARVPAMGREPEFDELIERGAFNRTLAARSPVLQFDHGMDPRTGTVPIGAFEEIRPDDHGLYVRARLFDNAVVEPIRQAIEGGAIKGMSFKMRVNDDSWQRSKGTSGVDLRSVREVELWECGPVVHPVYEATSVGVRSMLAYLDDEERDRLIRDLADHLRSAGAPSEPALVGTSRSAEPAVGTSGLSRAARDRALYLSSLGS